MFPPDLEALLARVGFHDLAAARARVEELVGDAAELLALVRLSADLGDALTASADPDAALRNLSRFVHARGSRLQLFHRLGDDPAAMSRLLRIFGASQYLADVLVRNPEYLELVSDSTLLETPRDRADLAKELETICSPLATAATQLDAIRRFRRREILRIGAADLCGLLDFREVTEQLSSLADRAVSQCLHIVENGRPSGLIVLALGKLGGSELNYSSDIDLIFVADNAEQLDASAQAARALTHALSDATGEGFLYRVDLRLRPYGGGGALVVSAAMLEEYLATSAHPAERQAMLKARAIAGDLSAGEAFLTRLLSTLFSDATTARLQVRELKQRIERQLVARGEVADHLKLGPGGIRDIEFIVQALQLEHGAAQPQLISTSTLTALAELAAGGHLSAADAHVLREAYLVLRLIEHRLQLMDNQQVHRLPENPAALHVLARTLGVEGSNSGRVVRDAYSDHARRVRAIFERVLVAPMVQVFQPATPNATPTAASECRQEVSRPVADLLGRICAPADVEILAERESHQRWTVTIALWDHIGVLSILAGLFAAHRIDIRSGVVRSPPLAGSSRRTKALDTFVVDTPRWTDEEFWAAFRRELGELTAMLARGESEAARERIVDRVCQAATTEAQPHTPLFPISVEVDNTTSPEATRLRIRSTNTVGFLFEFSAALAALNVNIHRVEIRTVHHEVHDTFWVTDPSKRKIEAMDRIHELQVAAALIKHFTHLLPRSPNPAQALRQFSLLARQMLSRADWVADLQNLESDAVLRTLAELMGVSQFLWEDFLREQHENLFPVVRNIPALDQRRSKEQLRAELAGQSDRPVARLNQFKDREMFRIDLRHITRRIDLIRFSHELTELAEIVIEEACGLCHAQLGRRFGLPMVAGGRPCAWCVCGLGKFGGRELGYASDVELIFVYEGEGQTNGVKPIANSRYFDLLVSTFLQTVVTRREGIFEIDLRLRPHGKAGSLACSLDGFAQYFSPTGEARQFERLALVKLRPVGGDWRLAEKVIQARDQFVYSDRPLDYENIRHLRQRQAAELVEPRTASAKHSQGGLVDLEYFVQTKQIEVGRAQTSVRVTSTLEAIDRLHQAGAFTGDQARELRDTYQFLRRLIEALRVVRGNAKDLTIPGFSSREFAHLARRMHFESPTELAREIDERMTVAQKLWTAEAHGEAQRRKEEK